LFIIGVSAFSLHRSSSGSFLLYLRDFLDLRGLGLSLGSLGLAVTLELGHFLVLIRY
jgi:hypothetical protein